jgi:hypothetical protein
LKQEVTREVPSATKAKLGHKKRVRREEGKKSFVVVTLTHGGRNAYHLPHLRYCGGSRTVCRAVKNLAAARKRLKQLAHNASGSWFLYSTQRGIVELMEHQKIRRKKDDRNSVLKNDLS